MFQQIIIVGNVGRDPELSYTPQGVAVAKFSVAVNKVTGKGENRKEKTTWFRVTVWRERAETVSQYVKKGMKIMVIGEVEVSAYIDKSGSAAATIELTADDFKFLDSRPDGDNAPARQSAAPHTHEDDPDEIPF
jgi:single-strand DNA-binding protein